MSAQLAGKMLLALAALGAGGSASVRAADEPKKDQPGEPKVVKLAAPVRGTVLAGDGRYIVLHMPEAKQLAVFDVKEGKVVKSLPAPEDDIKLAGALDYFFVLRKSNNTMQRWSLATFEKEATVRLPVETAFEEICMGHASNGPMLLCPTGDWSTGAKVTVLNPVTMRELTKPNDWLPNVTPGTLRASPDGQVFSWAVPGNRQIAVARAADGKFAAKTYSGETYGLQPGPGGRFFYTSSHAYDEEVRKVHPRPGTLGKYWIAPAAHGPFFLELEQVAGPPMSGPKGYSRVHVFFEGHDKPVATISDVNKPNETSNFPPYFIPRLGRLIFYGKNTDELILHSFDLDALLAKTDVDYLAVMSEPPREVIAGKTFEYSPLVKSKKGGVKLTLEAGPDGMKLGADGKLTWAVPATMTKQEVVVIMTVADSSGRDMFHTFRLAVVAPSTEKP